MPELFWFFVDVMGFSFTTVNWKPDEIGFHPAPHIRAFLLPARIFRLRSNEALHRIGENYRLATAENIAVNPVHYHSVALLQLGRKPTFGHRIDSEYIGADAPC